VKWILSSLAGLACLAGTNAAEPLPGTVVMPSQMTMHTTPSVPHPTMAGTTSWGTVPASDCAPTSAAKSAIPSFSGACLDKLKNWVMYRPAPYHHPIVATPGPERTKAYRDTPSCNPNCPTGYAPGDTVAIPLPTRYSGSLGRGCDAPMLATGKGCNTCSSCSPLHRMLGTILPDGFGCGQCKYKKGPMVGSGFVESMACTQSVGSTRYLTSGQAAPAGYRYADPVGVGTGMNLYPGEPERAILPKGTAPTAPTAPTPMPSPAPVPTPGPMSAAPAPQPGHYGAMSVTKPFTNP
jgi:hypothetical protein